MFPNDDSDRHEGRTGAHIYHTRNVCHLYVSTCVLLNCSDQQKTSRSERRRMGGVQCETGDDLEVTTNERIVYRRRCTHVKHCALVYAYSKQAC